MGGRSLGTWFPMIARMPGESWLRLSLPFEADLVTDQNLTGIRCVSSFELPPSSVERWRGREVVFGDFALMWW